MTTIIVPAHVAAIAELEATAAASSVTTGLRSTGTTMSDVAEWMTAHGAPDDWTGDAAEAAEHAMTGSPRTPTAPAAAFTRVAAACDNYVDSIVAPHRRTHPAGSRRTRSTRTSTRCAPGSRAPPPTTSPPCEAEARSTPGPGRPAGRRHHQALGRRHRRRGPADRRLRGRRQPLARARTPPTATPPTSAPCAASSPPSAATRTRSTTGGRA